MKKTRLICQNPECGREYDALRDDSKHCSPACRTATYRIRLKAKEKFLSLHSYIRNETDQMVNIRYSLIRSLNKALEFDRAGRISLGQLRELRGNLYATINSWIKLKTGILSDQVDWIWTYVDGFLYQLIDQNPKSEPSTLIFYLGTEIRMGIEQLIRSSS